MIPKRQVLVKGIRGVGEVNGPDVGSDELKTETSCNCESFDDGVYSYNDTNEKRVNHSMRE